MPDPIKVLVVDDLLIMRRTLLLMLSTTRHIEVVDTAENGIEAYEKTKLKQVDLVLMDLNMPFMDGIRATINIVKSNPHIKVLALTFHDDEGLLSHVIEAGGHGYLTKPVRRDQLLDAIYAVMKGKYYLGAYASSRMPDLAQS